MQFTQNIVQKQALYNKLKKLTENNQGTQNQQKQKQNVLSRLPQSFWKFMKERQINIEEVLVEIPRFIRSKKIKQQNSSITLQLIAKDLGVQQSKIVKINDQCYALSPSTKINHSKLYQQAKIYGMDISSMMAVKCLDLESNSIILQLCSAPGNKSMYACDIIDQVKVVGVEINVKRANVMKSLIKKYNLDDRIEVIVEDAAKFQGKQLFDRVLVDTECTHQGSIKHLKKFTVKQQLKQKTKKQKKFNKNIQKQKEKQFQQNHNPYTSLYDKKNDWTVEDFQKRFLDPVKLSNLFKLQRSLIKNGFKHLKPGGIMVYSTCSIDKRQNQQIVQQLLNEYKDEAELLDASQSLKDCQLNFRRGELQKTVYFTPKLSMCGGMFISKIRKVKQSKIIQQQKQQ